MLLRLSFDFAYVAECFDDHFHDLAAFLDVGHLAAPEQDADLHLILMLQELLRLPDLRADILFARLGAQPDLFCLGVMTVRPILFLPLLVLVLSIVHHAADGWSLTRSYLNQVQARVAGNCPEVKTLIEAHYGLDQPIHVQYIRFLWQRGLRSS